jgi:hypothetical protein
MIVIVKKKSLRLAILRGEIKITPNDILAFEDRANKLQYMAGQARLEANTVSELYKQQGHMIDDNFCKRKDYKEDIKHSLIVNF